MKKNTIIILAAAALFASSCSYDDTAIYSELDSINNRITALENSVTQLSDYQTIKDKVNNGKFIESYAQGTDGSYTLTFSDKATITIKNGNDGANGTNGEDGKDGKTPSFKIESENWYVSYDNGAKWDLVGSAIDRSLFKAVEVEGENIKITLADDTVVTLPVGEKNQFRLNVDESAVNVSYSSLLSSRTRSIDIPFTLSGNVENPRIIVTFDYPYLSATSQSLTAVVNFNDDATSGVITVKQPLYNSRDGVYSYLEAAEATVNIIAFNGDGQSSVRSKHFNGEYIECLFDSSFLYNLVKVDEEGVPYFDFPKEGGPFKVSITRQLYCTGISDVSNLVRPSSFDDVWAINFFSSYGTISDKSLTINDYFSEYEEFYEEYSVTFNVKPNPGTKERILGGSVGKFQTEANNTWTIYFPFKLVQAGN